MLQIEFLSAFLLIIIGIYRLVHQQKQAIKEYQLSDNPEHTNASYTGALLSIMLGIFFLIKPQL